MTLAHNVQFRPFHLMSFRMNTKMKISPRPQASPRPPPDLPPLLSWNFFKNCWARPGQARPPGWHWTNWLQLEGNWTQQYWPSVLPSFPLSIQQIFSAGLPQLTLTGGQQWDLERKKKIVILVSPPSTA